MRGGADIIRRPGSNFVAVPDPCHLHIGAQVCTCKRAKVWISSSGGMFRNNRE